MPLLIQIMSVGSLVVLFALIVGHVVHMARATRRAGEQTDDQ
jgi:hypothetical protein